MAPAAWFFAGFVPGFIERATGLAAALEASALGQWMRGDVWAYPVANVVHLFGLTLLVGPILLLDLRLLGFGRVFPVAAASRVLTAWSVAGLLVMLVSGVALFSADAGPLLGNPVMQFKLVAIALAIGNALAFRWLWSSHIADWDRSAPVLGRLQSVFSMLLWLTIPVAGRMIAYL